MDRLEQAHQLQQVVLIQVSKVGAPSLEPGLEGHRWQLGHSPLLDLWLFLRSLDCRRKGRVGCVGILSKLDVTLSVELVVQQVVDVFLVGQLHPFGRSQALELNHGRLLRSQVAAGHLLEVDGGFLSHGELVVLHLKTASDVRARLLKNNQGIGVVLSTSNLRPSRSCLVRDGLRVT